MSPVARAECEVPISWAMCSFLPPLTPVSTRWASLMTLCSLALFHIGLVMLHTKDKCVLSSVPEPHFSGPWACILPHLSLSPYQLPLLQVQLLILHLCLSYSIPFLMVFEPYLSLLPAHTHTHTHTPFLFSLTDPSQ